jgi:methionyl-tRNA formyltransferase
MQIEKTPSANVNPLTGLRIVFMGTAEFAVASLDELLQAGCQVVGIATAPDRPAGRGMKLQQSAVKKYALGKFIPILQPEKLKNPDFLQQLASLRVDLQIVVAFRMLPEVVWNMPPLGTINLHGSLLPQYRGAAPINWALINGEKSTGVTTFKMQQEIDTGNILMQESLPIGENETAGELHDRMKQIGAQLLVATLKGLVNGTLKEKPQRPSSNPGMASEEPLKLAPKISMETCEINWDLSVDRIHNLIRGLSPSPGAYTNFDGKVMKIFKSHKELAAVESSPGSYATDKKTFLKFASLDGYIYADEVQLAGRMKMGIGDFLRGYRFN